MQPTNSTIAENSVSESALGNAAPSRAIDGASAVFTCYSPNTVNLTPSNHSLCEAESPAPGAAKERNVTKALAAANVTAAEASRFILRHAMKCLETKDLISIIRNFQRLATKYNMADGRGPAGSNPS